MLGQLYCIIYVKSFIFDPRAPLVIDLMRAISLRIMPALLCPSTPPLIVSVGERISIPTGKVKKLPQPDQMHSRVWGDEPTAHDNPSPYLNQLQHCASLRLSRTCIQAQKLSQRRYYDDYVLLFGGPSHATQDRWECIARVYRVKQLVERLASQLETMRYIRSHTSIPLPDIYFHDFDENNEIGAQFMLMERLPGIPFSQLRDHLQLDDKKAVVTDIANVLIELATLKFEEIGCLRPGGSVGPLLYRNRRSGRLTSLGPFTSTTDYLLSFLQRQTDGGGPLDQAQGIIEQYMDSVSYTKGNSSLDGPFRIIHDDLSAVNILVVRSDADEDSCRRSDIRVSGIIDWECVETGPVYFLYDYPVFLQDNYCEPQVYTENKQLRTHFIKTLIERFPWGSPELMEISKSLNKSFTLNGFKNRIVGRVRSGEESDVDVASYVFDHYQETGRAYERGPEWLGAPDVQYREYIELGASAGLIDKGVIESMYGIQGGPEHSIQSFKC